MRRSTPHRQRGVAALEFAITVPAFLALLAGVIYFGLMLYAKFVMVNAANASVRACVIKNVGYKTSSVYEDCVRRNFNGLVNTSSGGLCSQGVDNIQVTSSNLGASNATPGMLMLTLSFNCKVLSGGGLMNPSKQGAEVPALFSIPITSSMPYFLK